MDGATRTNLGPYGGPVMPGPPFRRKDYRLAGPFFHPSISSILTAIFDRRKPCRIRSFAVATWRSANREERIMAVAVVMEFAGATLAQYDQVIEKMGLTRGGAGPEGAL